MRLTPLPAPERVTLRDAIPVETWKGTTVAAESALTVSAPMTMTVDDCRDRAAALLPDADADTVERAAAMLAAMLNDPHGTDEALAALVSLGAMTADDVESVGVTYSDDDAGTDYSTMTAPTGDRSVTGAPGVIDSSRAVVGSAEGFMGQHAGPWDVDSVRRLTDLWVAMYGHGTVPALIGRDATVRGRSSWEQVVRVDDPATLRANMGASVSGDASRRPGMPGTRVGSLAYRTGATVPCKDPACIAATGKAHGHRTGPTVAERLTVSEWHGIGVAAVLVTRIPSAHRILAPADPVPGARLVASHDRVIRSAPGTLSTVSERRTVGMVPERARTRRVTVRHTWDRAAGRWVTTSADTVAAARARTRRPAPVTVSSLSTVPLDESGTWTDGTVRLSVRVDPDDRYKRATLTVAHGTGADTVRRSRRVMPGEASRHLARLVAQVTGAPMPARRRSR